MDDSAFIPRPIRERLPEFYRRLAELPRAGSAAKALEQLCQELDRVEDEMSGIPKQTPPPWPADPDGRMYCPQEDFTEKRADGSILALTRGHRVEIDSNGSVRIIDKVTGHVEFEK